MFGFSVYLNEPIDDEVIHYMNQMKYAGFSGVFTSLHIPEDNPQILSDRVKVLSSACAQLNLKLIADVSAEGLARMGIDIEQPEQILSLGLSGLRIDYGVNLETIAKLSQRIPIALNASTISEDDVQILHLNRANFDHLEAWHNYYPRPETGLDRQWFMDKNRWLSALGFSIEAFVSGDGRKRGPLHLGLPTLEEDRTRLPLAAALDLKKAGVKRVYIGDSSLNSKSIAQFTAYLQSHQILLSIHSESRPLFNQVWHNRSDTARDVIRLEESRQQKLISTKPNQILPRLKGSITIDNTNYLRYAGEIQITRHDLPPDPRVNIIGRVSSTDMDLVDEIGAAQAIRFLNI